MVSTGIYVRVSMCIKFDYWLATALLSSYRKIPIFDTEKRVKKLWFRGSLRYRIGKIQTAYWSHIKYIII